MKKTIFLLLVVFAPAAGAAYKCVDEKGAHHVGDTVPAACANVVVYETSKSGNVIRKIDPTPSADEVKRRQDEAQRRKEADKVAAEQKRKDMALLNTFSSEREFDVVRDRTIEPVAGRIKNARERIAALDKRDKEIEEEMEFYKAGKAGGKTREAPFNLVQERERITQERRNLNASIAASEKEIADLKVRFDEDRKRWVAIRASMGRTAPAKTVDVVPAGEAKAVKKN